MQVFVDNSTIALYLDSLYEIMQTEPQRVTEISGRPTRYVDTKTDVSFTIEPHVDKKERWLLHIPGGKSFVMNEEQTKKLSKAVNNRENALLIEQHKILYGDENIYKIFTEIQKCRDKPMVEEAWQNLLTIYALNMDGDDNVS